MYGTHLSKTGAALALGLLLFLATACREADEAETYPEETEEAMTGTDNTLTAAEKAEGWQLLFDGTTLDHWRGFKQDSVPSAWKAQDGTIYCAGGSETDLVTRDQYENFDLKLEWKISPGGNSGIMFHADENHDNTWETGPEMQVLDDAAHADAVNPAQRAGASYDMQAPSVDVVRPAGEWNQVRILVDGPHVEYWLNGEKIVEYELWSDGWKQQVANSKWKDYPDYGLLKTGHIALQDHGDPVWYRNIKIRPLPATTPDA